jgi:hypothetical protein
MKLKDLKADMPYKWRVQSFSKFKPLASCVAYIDARDVMDRLDAVCGIENWQDDYRLIDGKLFAGIGILIGDRWVWKWDTGVESNIEKEKGQSSDAFKRAGVKWSIGRFLYHLDIKYITASEKKTKDNNPFVVDGKGQRVWDLTKHINETKPSTKVTEPKPESDKQKKYKDYDFLKHAKKAKEVIGEVEYYSVLGLAGYEKSDEVKPEDRERVLKAWREKVKGDK